MCDGEEGEADKSQLEISKVKLSELRTIIQVSPEPSCWRLNCPSLSLQHILYLSVSTVLGGGENENSLFEDMHCDADRNDNFQTLYENVIEIENDIFVHPMETPVSGSRVTNISKIGQ